MATHSSILAWRIPWTDEPAESDTTCCCVVVVVAQLCPTLCNSKGCSTPGLPVLHHLLGLAQTHVHWVSDAILPSHPVAPFSSYSQSSPASGYFLMSRLFTSGSQSIGAPASVFLMNTQCWFPLGISLQSQRLSRAFSNTTVQKHQFFSSQLSLWSNSHIHKWLLEKPYLWLYRPLLSK